MLVISVPMSNVPVLRNEMAVKLRLETIVRIPIAVVFMASKVPLLVD
jgi:hypothetical protein